MCKESVEKYFKIIFQVELAMALNKVLFSLVLKMIIRQRRFMRKAASLHTGCYKNQFSHILLLTLII